MHTALSSHLDTQVKALMFYDQMKRHRLNKIKSKAYRTIRKRQRVRKEKEDAQSGAAVGSGSEDEDGVTAEQREEEAYKR